MGLNAVASNIKKQLNYVLFEIILTTKELIDFSGIPLPEKKVERKQRESPSNIKVNARKPKQTS